MKIALLSGDCIGPEVMDATMVVLERLAHGYGVDLQYCAADAGGVAIDKHGCALPESTIEVCTDSQAILFGSIGGPKWESLPPDQQPERAALLPLRKHFGLFANLRPTTIFPMLQNASPLALGDNAADIDFIVVRELTGGIYFAQPKELTDDYAVDTMRYERGEVERIARMACDIAQERERKTVTSIDKANVLSSMVLWRRIVTEVATEYPEVTVEHLYVDNAAMQLIVNPQRFDVILCPNMFGDILSDEAAVLPGSIGMQPSASLGAAVGDGQQPCRFGLYEPAGGSAPDIAGTDKANPIAQILSAALMFRYSFGRTDLYHALRTAVERALTDGARTADIAEQGEPTVGTQEMGRIIASML